MLKPDPQYLKTLFILDNNGKLWWKAFAVDPSRHNRKRVGTEAGTLDPNGYIYIQINGKRYAAHQIVWAMTYGYWVSLDHINGIRSDNRIENLREATQAEQCQNRIKGQNKSSKYMGVSYRKNGKWLAQIRLNRKLYRLGLFDTEEKAYEAYLKTKERLHTFNPIQRIA